MKMLQLTLLFLLAGGAALLLTSCGGTGSSSGDNISELPWGRPQSWEGGSRYGNMPQSR